MEWTHIQNDPACARFAHFKKYRNNNAPSTKSLYDCRQKYDFLIRCIQFLLKTKQSMNRRTDVAETHTQKSVDGGSNDKQQHRRDHDITIATTINK